MYNLQVITTVLVLCASGGVHSEHSCLAGDFDSQIQYILQKQMLTSRDRAHISRTLTDVRNTLNKRWQNFEVIPFGSLVTGLGTKASDADFYVRMPNYNSSEDTYMIEETTKLFKTEPALYSQHRPKITTKVPILTFYHIPTHRYCDIVYKSSDGVKNSNVLGYFFKLDKRFLPLGIFLKFWSKIHYISGHIRGTVLRNYALYLLIIFYLQQRNLAPPLFVLQKDFDSHWSAVGNWNMVFKEIPHCSTNTETLYDVLGGFFQYYSEFNFKEYIVSPFAGRPIPKNQFDNIDRISEEFPMVKINKTRTIMKPLTFNSDVSIQDIFEHNINIAKMVSRKSILKFITHAKFAAKMFEELPSDRFLTAILIQDQHNETFVRRTNNVINQISKEKACINVKVT